MRGQCIVSGGPCSGPGPLSLPFTTASCPASGFRFTLYILAVDISRCPGRVSNVAWNARRVVPCVADVHFFARQATGNRFLLALALAVTVAWTLTSAGAATAAERAALVDLYNATDGSSWRNSANWLTGDPCSAGWYGVACSPGTGTIKYVVVLRPEVWTSSPRLRACLPACCAFKLTFVDVAWQGAPPFRQLAARQYSRQHRQPPSTPVSGLLS